jgi:hypothetical protein
MKLIDIIPSKNKNKKYTAIFEIDDKIKKVNFGASGYQDYTLTKNKDKRRLYRARHKHDNINNPLTPGALSFYILWGDSTNINKNIQNYKKKFDL